MFILVLIGVYLVFKVTTSYEKLHQDNTRSTERYVILREVIKLYKILEIVVISIQRDSYICDGRIYGKSEWRVYSSGALFIYSDHHRMAEMTEKKGAERLYSRLSQLSQI